MGLFNKVVGGVFGALSSKNARSQEDIAFENQVRTDGVAHAGRRIAEVLTDRIALLAKGAKRRELAEQFVLEELDAARHADINFVQNFVRDSGYKQVEYTGAMQKTEWEGEESEIEHLQLFVRAFTTKIHEPTFRARLSITIVDEVMKIWKLGKYSG